MVLKAHPISKYLVNCDGTVIKNPKTCYILNPSLSPAGYLKIGTYICSGGTVHQLVYEAFHSLVPKGLCINHKDGCKTNNDISNLEVVTIQENTKHAYLHGLAKGLKGEDNSISKISESDIMVIYGMLRDGRCNTCIGDRFSLHDRYVSLIRTGKRWKHLFAACVSKIK